MATSDPIQHLVERHGMPCKRIHVDGVEYLRRYYWGTTTAGNTDLWLHHVLIPDARHLHNHPFLSWSMVLSGAYLEEKEDRAVWRKPISDSLRRQVARNDGQGDVDQAAAHVKRFGHEVGPLDWHRIARISQCGPTWTLLAVDHRRLPYWFIRRWDGTLEWREAGPRDWWRNYV